MLLTNLKFNIEKKIFMLHIYIVLLILVLLSVQYQMVANNI